MIDENIKLSIEIPVYNQDKNLLLRCLDSIPARDDIEVIVCDDCSTNDTPEVLKNYTRIPLKIIRNEVNQGSGYSRHQCQLVAKGMYEIELGSDDYLYTDKCNEVIDNGLDKGYDLVYYDLETDYKDHRKWMFTQESKDHMSVGSTKCVSRKFAEGLYTMDLRVGYDGIFHKQLGDRNPNAVYTRIVMYHFSFPREGSISTHMINKTLDKYVRQFKTNKDLNGRKYMK